MRVNRFVRYKAGGKWIRTTTKQADLNDTKLAALITSTAMFMKSGRANLRPLRSAREAAKRLGTTKLKQLPKLKKL